MGDASVTSWRMWIRGRSLRPGRADNDEDEFQLDPNKDHAENLRDILTNICKKQGITSERKRLSYLNGFVKLLTKCEHDYSKLGFTAEEILYCLRPALLHDTTQVRSGGLRAMRYMLRSKHEAAISSKLQYPLLVARSLDLITGNDNERVQAMRVVRRLMCLDAAQFPACLARTMVAIASGTDDRLINVTLGALSELCVLNSELFISVGGVTTLLRSLSCVRSARMAEALVGSLLYLQNKPRTRLRAGLNLDCLAAPYTDLQHTSDRPKENQSSDRLKWPHVTLLSTLRSWPGVLHFCHPLKDGLRSIVATLYLNQLDVRKAVVDLLYELLCLAQPEWSDEMSVALEAVDPSRTQDAFKLSEGFVAAEGKAMLPHLSKCRVNLSELHLSLLLYCFLEVGLLDAIVEVIIAEDTFLSVRATILLGELLHLIHLLLPPECCHLSPSLPNLLSYAVRGRPHSTEGKDYTSPPPPPPVTSRTELPSKMDIIAMTMGERSGLSSVRTVSESSTDRGLKPESMIQKQTSDDGAEKRNTSENKSKSREATSYLLKDVREVLVDMTNAEVKSPRKRRAKDDSVSFSSEPAVVEPPACSRAQQKALAAVTTLSQLHRLLRQRPAPASVHLDHVLASVTGRSALEGMELARAKGKTQSRNKLNQVLTKECSEAIKDSQVLTNKDCFAWNWDIIRSILRSRPECLRKLDDNNHRQFIRRLVNFVMPTSNQMSRVDFSTDRRTVNSYILTAMELLDCLLLASDDSECEKLLTELLTGFKVQFDAISSGKSAHDCKFSPQAVGNSLCQDYFLLVGHLTRSREGCNVLDRLGILHTLLVLATTSKHDCYVKLIISSVDYSSDQRTRNIMSSTLVCPQESSRLYATKFLRVLLRTPLSKRGDYYARWVIELLANQLSDEDRAVSLTAVNALDEACDCKEYLEALIDLRPSLLHLGDKGLLLLIRFLSTEKGFSYMSEANFVSTQLAKWVKFNYKYVCIVEGELADGLTLVERNEDGRYSSRLSNNKRVPTDVYVPSHLYGQLARHSTGLSALLADDNVPKLLQVVLQGQCSTDAEILELKAALWALGHLSSCSGGALWARAYSVTRAIVSLACTSPVYSVRATAFHNIALTASCVEGADTLRAFGWHSVRHNRNQHWPVVAPLSLLEDALLLYQDGNQTSDSSESTTTEMVTKNGLFILGEDTSMDGTEAFSLFTGRDKTARERKSATLPPAGSSHTYHHNRSYSESKADGSEWRSNTPAPSHSGSDIMDCRSQEHPRLYSESSTSSGGDSSQYRTYFSDRVIQTLSPIPSSGSIVTQPSRRRVSVASSQGPQLSPKDVKGYAALRLLHFSRRPTFVTPHLTFHFPQSAPTSLSPLSPIELIAFQDWRQMSPLVRPRHPDNHHVEPQFEVSGPHCVLPGDTHSSGRTLHYESSRACIAPPPEDPEEENGEGPCFQGICLPQNLLDLFPMEEISVKAEDPADNASTTVTGMDISSCDSETDTAPEAEAERARPRAPPKRRHDHSSCLLCCVSRLATNKQTRRRKLSASSQHRTRTETESSYGGVGNDGESPVMLPWQIKGGLEGITSVDSSSTDITSSVAQRSMGDNFKSRSVIRKEIIRMAEQLCNPILYKTCKTALLQLKQIYSDVFNDICVYSDVCAVMSSASHRIYARRFLQELFLDAPFSEMYEDPLGILSGQNNTEGEEGGGVDKFLLGVEAVTSEEQTSEPNSWKNSVTKINGFDPDQRVIQGYELEVIMESDARSESSDHCRGRSSTLGSITPGEPRPSTSPLTSVEPGAQSESGDHCRGCSSTLGSIIPGEPRPSTSPLTLVEPKAQNSEQMIDYGSNLVHETRPSTSPATSTQSNKACCSITVSKSSQQLRKEFFNTTVPPTTNSEKEAISEKTSAERKSEEFVSKSTSTCKNMVDNLKGEVQDEISSVPSTSSKPYDELGKNEKQETKMTNHPKKTKEENVPENTKNPSEPSGKNIVKLKNGSKDLSPPVSNTNKSPLLAKKGKKQNPGNTKPSNVPSKIETRTPKTSIEQLTVMHDIELPQGKDCITHSINNEVRLESPVKKKTTKPQPKGSFESGGDATTSSKVVLKNTKPKTNDAIATGKPPSGSGRQRKKSTTKTPNRESLDTGRKKSDSESGSR